MVPLQKLRVTSPCSSPSTKYVSCELFWAWGGERGHTWCGTFAASEGHFTKDMIAKRRRLAMFLHIFPTKSRFSKFGDLGAFPNFA